MLGGTLDSEFNIPSFLMCLRARPILRIYEIVNPLLLHNLLYFIQSCQCLKLTS